MRKLLLGAVSSTIILSLMAPAFGAPKFSKGTSTSGAIVYQDDADPAQFWYLPLITEALIGDRLKTFKASHFGVGPAFYVQDSTGQMLSRAGGLLSGTYSINISDKQRAALLAQIKKDFGTASPKLLPVPLRDAKINSVVLDQIIGFGDAVQQKLPTNVQIGSEFQFSIGSLNSGFAQILANQQVGQGIQPSPHFGVNVTASVEYVGDPWTAIVECDLRKVWNQVRTKASASVSLGWFRIGSASYQNVSQDLKDTGACTFDMKEGSLDTAQYGRQIMDMTKKIFEEVNKLATAGDGFFKFDPNPQAAEIEGGGGPSLFGWGVSLNGGYSAAHFTQEKKWTNRITYTGRFTAPVAMSAIFAVSCGPETRQFFQDLANASEPCITQAKIDQFQLRAAREVQAKNVKLRELAQKLENGQVTPEQYDRLRALYNTLTFTDNLMVAVLPVGETPALNLSTLSLQLGSEGNKTLGYVAGVSDDQLAVLEKQVLESR